MSKVTVITPSRLHLALIDLNGGLGRVDGSIGLSLADPGFRITARRADEMEISGTDESVNRAEGIIALLREQCAIGNAKINIEESIPAHVGLGCGTQLSLAIAEVMCRLYDIKLSHREMAFLVGRGGTSGIGVAAFSRGGFILDGGHRFSGEKSEKIPPGPPFSKGGIGKDGKTSFLPSSESSGVEPPPVVARYDFPDWDILVAIPDCRHISGAEEVNLFQTLCPLPLSDVQAISHIILMKLLPALVQRDLEFFGDAIHQIQNIGWKKVEIEKQDRIVRQTMSFLRSSGARGVGLSSWGPAIFCFGENLNALKAETQAFFADKNAGGVCLLTRANNTGAMVIEEENGVYGSRFETADLQRAVHR